MKALQYVGAKKVEVREVPMIPPAPGQARIRVTYCGVCGSDIGIYSGKHPRAKAPLTIGHEFVGVIEEINGEANGLQMGGTSRGISAAFLRKLLRVQNRKGLYLRSA